MFDPSRSSEQQAIPLQVQDMSVSMRRHYEFAVNQTRQGWDRNVLIAELISMKLDPALAEELVDRVYKEQGVKPKRYPSQRQVDAQRQIVGGILCIVGGIGFTVITYLIAS